MNAIRSILAVAAIAVLGLAAAPAAHAQTRPLIEYKTVGGFVIYNIDLKVYADGFVVAQETAVRRNNESILMYDFLTPSQLRALKAAFDATRFQSLPPVLRTR